MKYDILNGFQEYLYQNLSKNTAKTYYSTVNKIFNGMSFDDLGQIPEDVILERVEHLRSKNQVSAAKNGLKNLYRYDQRLNLPDDQAFSRICRHKRNHVKSKGKKVEYDQIRRKINSMNNKKLKLAFRLAIISGLRVSELADLKTKDIIFDSDGRIIVTIRRGKGGSSGQVECLCDKYVFDKLKEYCKVLNENDKLFYSESYMRERAGMLRMEMHDFRRLFAALKKNECLLKGDTRYEANAKVQEGLRHKRFSTTKRYLYGRKIILIDTPHS